MPEKIVQLNEIRYNKFRKNKKRHGLQNLVE